MTELANAIALTVFYDGDKGTPPISTVYTRAQFAKKQGKWVISLAKRTALSDLALDGR